MKRQWMWALLFGMYGILLAALIILQWAAMRGDILRMLANLLALLLACPVVIGLVVSGRADSENEGGQEEALLVREENGQRDTMLVQSDADADRQEEMTPAQGEEARTGGAALPTAGRRMQTMEEFCEWVEQWKLSAREQEVGWLIYRGYTNRQIAQELYIAETTVKKHAGHIYEKAGVSGRKEFQGK